MIPKIYPWIILKTGFGGHRVGVLMQKQPPRDFPKKRCSENMQQIYRRIPMPKCDFSKVALHKIALNNFF